LEILPSTGKTDQTKEAILISELSLGYTKDTDVVHSVTSTLKRNTITMIIGPVGAGKSSMLLGLLGELRSNKGFVRMDHETVGYCSQSAWLPNATVKQIVAGTDEILDEIDEVWLQTVLQACVLDVDIQEFPNGDDSVIGSRGLTLSGGQRQRLALARAVYQRPSLMILDDIFSALDAKTETLVFDRLFSASGLFRKHATTVVLATHAGKCSTIPSLKCSLSNEDSSPPPLSRSHNCSRSERQRDRARYLLGTRLYRWIHKVVSYCRSEERRRKFN
jgi:ATP-binding cassette subfamily C (CFTR/MRP) protein 1